MDRYHDARLFSVLALAFLAASDAALIRSSAAEEYPATKAAASTDDSAGARAPGNDSGNARPQTAPSVPAAEPAPLLVGFDLSGSAENSVAEVGRFTNLAVIGDWMTKAGQNRLLAARDAGMNVVLSLFEKQLDAQEARFHGLLAEHAASVHAVLWRAQQVSPQEVLGFGRDLKSRYPGIQFWVAGGVGNNTALHNVPDGDDVDAFVWDVWSIDPGAAHADVQRIPRGSRSRPIFVRWNSHDLLQPDGRVPNCRIGTYRSLLVAVHERQFSGVVFSGYGAIAGAVGIGTRPELVEEIRTTAESISRGSATELCRLTAETERLYEEGIFSEALGKAQRRTEVARELYGPESAPHYAALVLLGLIHDALGSREDAARTLDQARAIRSNLLGVFDPGYAESLYMRAYNHLLMGDFAKGRSLCLRSLEIREKTLGKTDPECARSLRLLGYAYYRMGDLAQAELEYLKALQIEKSRGDDGRAYGTNVLQLANLYSEMGNHTKAEKYLLEALEVFKRVFGEKHPETAGPLIGLANVYYAMGHYTKALPLCTQALEIKRKGVGELHPEYAALLGNLARLYDEMGQYAEAETLYLQAQKILRNTVGDTHPDYAIGLSNLALLYSSMGDYAQAEPLYRAALEIRTRSLGPDHPAYASNLHNLALLYYSMKEYAKAEALDVQALKIRKEALGEDHPDYAITLLALADVRAAKHEYAEAEPLYVQALEILARAVGENHPHYAATLNNLATMYYVKGDYAKAEPLFVRAQEMYRKSLGESHPNRATGPRNLALLHIARSEYAEAEPLASAAFRTTLQVTRDLLPALPEVRGLALAAEIDCHPGLWLSVARHLPPSSRPDVYSAVWHSRGVVTHTLSERRNALLGSTSAKEVYARLRSVSETLAQLTLTRPLPQQTATHQRRLEGLTHEKEDLQAELAGLSGEYRRTRTVRQAEPRDLARLLPKGTAVVDLARVVVWSPPVLGRGGCSSEWHYEAFVLRHWSDDRQERVPWIQIGPAAPIDEAIDRWRRTIMDEGGSGTETNPPEVTLRKAIWDKLEPCLAGCTQVIIIPSGHMNFLPWAALPGRRQGTVLIDDYAVAVAASGQQLYDTLTAPAAAAGGMVLVGGVDYDNQPTTDVAEAAALAAVDGTSATRSGAPALRERLHVSYLPGSLAEMEGIRLTPPLAPPVLLSGKAASETALRTLMPQSRYIHLATHGFFADESFGPAHHGNPTSQFVPGAAEDLVTARLGSVTARNPLILSGVVLSGANLPPKLDQLGLPTGEDGILTAEEIVTLDLRGTELAVLSACDTGLGNVAGNEGVMGLTRAFHLAGARNVIASLWKVDDDATAALMRLFYHKLWQEQKQPIEALREAQLTIYRHPETIAPLANGSRGPKNISQPVKLPHGPPSTAAPSCATTKQWAAFVLSGTW